MTSPLLEIRNLSVRFQSGSDQLTAVDGVDLTIDKGETLGIVGESGCGKTVLATSLLGLLPSSARVATQRLQFSGIDLSNVPSGGWRSIRGRRIGMVFQDPTTALNPLRTIGSQLAESIAIHDRSATSREIRKRIIDLLESVGIVGASGRLSDYPHQWSGGMRQRALIAMAISNSPDLLIADEPTTALDVTIQAQVLELLRSIQRERELAMIFISHSLGVVNSIADRISVMYAGRIIESGPCSEVLTTPSHPYTRALIDCFPEIGRSRGSLVAIDGHPPRHIGKIAGCRFRDRCNVGRNRLDCASHDPVLKRAAGDRSVACHAVVI